MRFARVAVDVEVTPECYVRWRLTIQPVLGFYFLGVPSLIRSPRVSALPHPSMMSHVEPHAVDIDAPPERRGLTRVGVVHNGDALLFLERPREPFLELAVSSDVGFRTTYDMDSIRFETERA